MSIAIDGLLFGWKKNLDYGPKLVEDLSEEQMVQQPQLEGDRPSNHPAWVLSHLNAYLPVIVAIIEGREFEDPKEHRFGMQSQPEADRSVYASKEALVDEFVRGHQEVANRLAAAEESVLDQPIVLPRWKAIMPQAGIALPYLMLNHENNHLGQLSTWRRVQGMAPV